MQFFPARGQMDSIYVSEEPATRNPQPAKYQLSIRSNVDSMFFGRGLQYSLTSLTGVLDFE
jgi:hypothetical protein